MTIDQILAELEELALRLMRISDELYGAGAIQPHSPVHSTYIGVRAAGNLLEITLSILRALK